MFGDKMMARVSNSKYLNDEGGSATGPSSFSKLQHNNDSLVENIVFGTRRFQLYWWHSKKQAFSIDKKYFTLTQISRSRGTKNVQYFKKLSN